ncbi:MAG: tripartite tricarboxylate transporter substrate-binding protein [Pseudomonadota bacterium]
MKKLLGPAVRLSLLCVAMTLSAVAHAAFPEKPVRLIVPFPAGGPIDVATRILADRLSKTWGQSVIVDNRPGASGAIGTDVVIKSPADGYTLLVNGSIMVSAEVTRPSVRYRTMRDLIPVSLVVTTPVVYVASNESTKGTLAEILAAGVAKPGDLTYGSLGDGTTGHYLGEKLGKAQQVPMTHVPFGGETPILTALMGGHVKTSFLTGLSAKKVTESGKARMLAVASPKRSTLLPEVPTFIELGYPGFDRGAWVMVLAPVGTPQAVVDQVSREVDRILKQPDVQQTLSLQGMETRGGTPAEAVREVQTEFAYWVALVKDFGSLAK